MAWITFTISARLLFRRMGLLLMANVLWLLLSLLILPLPAATAGLFYLAHRVILEERARAPHYARLGDFWVGFRRYGWLATRLIVADVALLLLLVIAFRFYNNHPVDVIRWISGPVLLVSLTWLGAQLYLVPLMVVRPELGVLGVAKHALLTTISAPLDSALLVVWLLTLSVVCVLLAGPVLLLLFSMLAVTQTMALRILRIQRGEIPSVVAGAETVEESPY